MAFRIATWNINSVRLRIDKVVRLLREWEPDVLCLQETKCPQGQFPSAPLTELGYAHIAEHGQKGYHGVAIVSRLPFQENSQHSREFAGKSDCRHVAVTIGRNRPVTLHNFYVPAGGDEPDPIINEKFDHKLRFLEEMDRWGGSGTQAVGEEAILVGDLNIAPLVHDVWSHKDLLKVVSHTPVETESLLRVQASGGWTDVMRRHVPPEQRLYTWWSYRARDWDVSDRGRRLDHVWATHAVAETSQGISVLREARGWDQPSDHVPVVADFALEI